MLATYGLLASVVATALWSGLLLTLTTLLHPLYVGRDAAGFARDMHRFLPVARRSPTNDPPSRKRRGPRLGPRGAARPTGTTSGRSTCA